MRLSRDEVKKIAHLARVALLPREDAIFGSELSEIIDYNAKKLALIKKSSVVARHISRDLGQRDLPRPSLSTDEALANAPSQKDGLFSVPRILE